MFVSKISAITIFQLFKDLRASISSLLHNHFEIISGLIAIDTTYFLSSIQSSLQYHSIILLLSITKNKSFLFSNFLVNHNICFSKVISF